MLLLTLSRGPSVWASFSRRALSKASWVALLLQSGLEAAAAPVIHETWSEMLVQALVLTVSGVSDALLNLF